MRELKSLFEKNAKWSKDVRTSDASFFERLSQQQTPDYLWIGCADSRVPANQIIGLDPGEVFVHRNVANLVVHTDLNCLSAIQYAVDVLRVKHIIVCGHYGCGGVEAAISKPELGLIENWLRHIEDVYSKHEKSLEKLEDHASKVNRLCELNVIEQVVNVCRTTIVRGAWRRGQALAVHGWVYGLSDGLLRDLDMCLSQPEEVDSALAKAVQRSVNGIALAVDLNSQPSDTPTV
ncbi:MAG: carbonate dehydratase [bacterium]|nr:carbonate dehydratase [bacterium]